MLLQWYVNTIFNAIIYGVYPSIWWFLALPIGDIPL
jgi:hypothetical protein